MTEAPYDLSRMAATLDGVTVETYPGAEGFSALEREWNELEDRAAEDNIFLTHLWQHAWWTELGREERFELVAFRADGRLVVTLLQDNGDHWLTITRNTVVHLADGRTGTLADLGVGTPVRVRCTAPGADTAQDITILR